MAERSKGRGSTLLTGLVLGGLVGTLVGGIPAKMEKDMAERKLKEAQITGVDTVDLPTDAFNARLALVKTQGNGIRPFVYTGEKGEDLVVQGYRPLQTYLNGITDPEERNTEARRIGAFLELYKAAEEIFKK